MTKQITPEHVRRALAQERRGTAPRPAPRSVLKQILATVAAKDLEYVFRPRRGRP